LKAETTLTRRAARSSMKRPSRTSIALRARRCSWVKPQARAVPRPTTTIAVAGVAGPVVQVVLVAVADLAARVN
jgi:hypothetical protein